MIISGIYIIKNNVNNKIYVGKSKNIKLRFYDHKYYLTQKIRNKKLTNRYLYQSVQKHGIKNFSFIIIECFLKLDEEYSKIRELYWMDYYSSYDNTKGYNLRRDSTTNMIVHEDTKLLQHNNMLGDKNPNYNNKWDDNQKIEMSIIKKEQHKNGLIYNADWKNKISIASKETWKDLDKRKAMAKNVSIAKQKYNFIQYSREGVPLVQWDSIEEIIEHNPTYKWQNIYSVCNGYKPTIYGYIWRKELKI